MRCRFGRRVFWVSICCFIGILLTQMHIGLVLRTPYRIRSQCLKTVAPVKHVGGKWLVIGTDAVSEGVTRVPHVPGWNIVVVQNRNDPVSIQCRSCYCLDDESIQNLHFETAKLLPAGHRHRKLIGYLFALKHGAKYIYDINHPTHKSNTYILGEKTTGIKYNTTDIFNPYIHFGQLKANSNSFPSDWNRKNQSLQYYLGVWKTPLIQEQFASSATSDSAAPGVLLGVGTLALTSTQSNTLYLRDAFWALFRGLSGSHISRILRGFWAQRLLWEVGGTMGFTSEKWGNPKKIRISVSQNNKIQKVVSFIKEWNCPLSESFYECVVKLSGDLIQFGVFSQSDVSLLNSWLRDLSTLNTTQPSRCEEYQQCEALNHRTVAPVQFIPNVISHSMDTQSASRHRDGISKLCPNIKLKSPSKPLLVFPNILLIIVFNYPKYYSNIRYLETLYRGHFPNILYCGDKFENFQKADKGFDDHVSFLEVDTMRGRIAFRCLLRAIEMNYNVDGYLYMGDDVLINPWTLKNLDQKKIWHKYPRLFKTHDNTFWWKSPIAYTAWRDGLRALEAKNKKVFDRFSKQWKQNIKSNDVFYQQFTDIIYVPQRYAKTFLHFAEYFSRYPTHVEIAVPNVVAGMDSFNNYINLTGNYLSLEERKQFQKHFNKNHNFLHSVKTGPVFKTVDGAKFFCETYFPLDC